MSPVQLSLKKLRKEGWLVAITERWNPYARVRQDLFGFADLVALRGDEVLAIQTTSASNVNARIDKIKELPAHSIWLRPPYRRIIVHGWRKGGPRGKRKVWTCREVEIL